MNEKMLLKVAVICSGVGLLVLFFVADTVTVDNEVVRRIDTVGEDVKILGEVTKVADQDTVLFVEVQRPETITVVVFKDTNVSVGVGDTVEVIGEVDEYEGQLNVIAHRLRKLT